MLSNRDMSGSSAQRYLNDIRAVLNFALEEFDLEQAKNPFSKLSIPASSGSKEDRRAFTKDELIAVKGRVQAHVNPELQLIWKILEGTGCRIAEVTGLFVSDVLLTDRIPHLVIQEHPHRRLKTRGSSRLVPLVGGALSAAEEAIKDLDGKEPDKNERPFHRPDGKPIHSFKKSFERAMTGTRLLNIGLHLWISNRPSRFLTSRKILQVLNGVHNEIRLATQSKSARDFKN